MNSICYKIMMRTYCGQTAPPAPPPAALSGRPPPPAAPPAAEAIRHAAAEARGGVIINRLHPPLFRPSLAAVIATGADDTSFPSTIFHFVTTKCPFPISVTTALTKTLTYPSALGGHTLNAAARFMTYPKL